MTLKKLLFLAAMMISAAAFADEIILKSGKIITGRITAETDKSYTVKIRSNMFLSVDKEDVASASRAKPQEAPRQIWRFEEPKVEKSTSAPASASPGQVHPSTGTSTAVSAVKNAREVVNNETTKVGRTEIQRITRFKNYDVTGSSFAAVKKAIQDRSKGLGFSDGRRRRASRTEWQSSWTGAPADGGKQWKSIVLVATITVSLPAWKSSVAPAADDAAKWAELLKESTERETEHMEIINDAIVSFAESASNLRESDEKMLRSETEALFRAVQDQAAKRRQGYDRREEGPLIPIKKKKS